MPIDPVSAELRRWASEPFDWAEANCGLSILDYVERVTGRVLAGRPVLTDRRSVAALVRGTGGMVPLCASLMARLGMAPTTSPVRGDVGVVQLRTGATACILAGGLWAARGADGPVFTAGVADMAWSVACPRQ